MVLHRLDFSLLSDLVTCSKRGLHLTASSQLLFKNNDLILEFLCVFKRRLGHLSELSLHLGQLGIKTRCSVFILLFQFVNPFLFYLGFRDQVIDNLLESDQLRGTLFTTKFGQFSKFNLLLGFGLFLCKIIIFLFCRLQELVLLSLSLSVNLFDLG